MELSGKYWRSVKGGGQMVTKAFSKVLGVGGVALLGAVVATTAASSNTPEADFKKTLERAETAENLILVSTPTSHAQAKALLATPRIGDAFRKAATERSRGLAERRQSLKSDGLVFVDTAAKIKIRSVRVSGTKAVVSFDEDDIYRTQATVTSKSDVSATEEVTGRFAKFNRVGGKWVLQSVELKDTSARAKPLNRP